MLTSGLGYKKTVASALGVFFHLALSLWEEVSCHVVSSSDESPVWQETDIWSQQPVRTWGLSVDIWMSGSFPSQVLRWLQSQLTCWPKSCERPQVRGTQLSCAWIPTETEIIDVCCFKLLNLRMVYYNSNRKSIQGGDFIESSLLSLWSVSQLDSSLELDMFISSFLGLLCIGGKLVHSIVNAWCWISSLTSNGWQAIG